MGRAPAREDMDAFLETLVDVGAALGVARPGRGDLDQPHGHPARSGFAADDLVRDASRQDEALSVGLPEHARHHITSSLGLHHMACIT
jgi:hypothetical protein